MKLIFEYIKKYKLTYIGVVIIFIIGIIIGIIFSFKTGENDKKEIQAYVQDSVEVIKTNTESKQSIFFQTFIQDAKFSLITWILGCTIIAGFTIYILMLYKGFLMGYIISILINIFGISQGLTYSSLLLIIQNIIFLPAVFLLATSGIRLYKGIIKKEINLKYEIIRHCVILVITLIVGIISACLEAYFLVIFL